MDKLARLREYSRIYMAGATQLATSRHAREWMEMQPPVPAEVAAQWASLGYLAAEAAPLIAVGRKPEEVAVTEAAEEAAAGGPEALVRDRIERIADDPSVIVDPDVADRWLD